MGSEQVSKQNFKQAKLNFVHVNLLVNFPQRLAPKALKTREVLKPGLLKQKMLNILHSIALNPPFEINATKSEFLSLELFTVNQFINYILFPGLNQKELIVNGQSLSPYRLLIVDFLGLNRCGLLRRH